MSAVRRETLNSAWWVMSVLFLRRVFTALAAAGAVLGVHLPTPALSEPGPATEEARAFLAEAMDLIRRHHIARDTADWATLDGIARREADGARTPADTHDAVRAVLHHLGEEHSQFHAPPPPRPADAATPPPRLPPQPQGRLVDGRFGAVTVPPYNGSRDQGVDYAERLRGFLREFDAAGACGWIVDVRGNSGGNLWPMFDGIGPLLGGPGILSFEIVGDRVYQVLMRDGVAVQDGGPRPPALRPVTLRDPDAPVAVLMDGRTASSGEAVVIAFAGRPNVRTFGTKTGGFITVNNFFPLSDGSALAITVGWNRDRTGRVYKDAIQPEAVADGPDEAVVTAAARWLSEHPACRR